MIGPVQRSASSALEREVTSVLARDGGLAVGEIVTHFDIVAETRLIDDDGTEHIRRHHWSPVGSSPHVSYGLMAVEAERILRRISAD